MYRGNLAFIERATPEKILANLVSENGMESQAAGLALIESARASGLNLRDYLTVKINPRLDEKCAERFTAGQGEILNGYEASLAYLNLPVRDDLENGVLLKAASDTFATFPGVRAIFPEVVDDMVRYKYRQTQFETVEALIGNSRTIDQAEVLSTVVDDDEDDYKADVSIAETARIPVSTIRASQQTVKIWKHGRGYRTSYEFSRRASIDMLVPYAVRAQRELELSKVAAATDALVNGDGLQAAATVTTQSSLNSSAGVNAVNGTLSYKHLVAWFVARAKAGYPIDTVVGDWDAYLAWLFLFAVPTAESGEPNSQTAARAGFTMGGVPIVNGSVNFALSSTSPSKKLVGFSKADTVEELVESGSLIDESERSARNQTVSYYRTQNVGYRVIFGDTRSVFNYNA